MNIFVIVMAVGFVQSATLLNSSEIPDELFTNTSYLLFEREDGLFEVENFEKEEVTSIPLILDNDVTFYVYTPENHTGISIQASQAEDIIHLTGFNSNRSTVVITHGWRNSFRSRVNIILKKAFLENRMVNVIIVDWNKIASRSYRYAQRSVLSVGNFIGDFFIRLKDELGYSLRRITLVGHSLGAHVSGNAGARTGGLIDTIVGLDPAGPLFTARNTTNRLDQTDGKYVHVIHTNDRVLGFNLKMGHADYYPNGGSVQPGCGIDLAGTCAHRRAYIYYAESISSNRFLSRRCESFSLFRNGQCNTNTSSFLGSWPVIKTTTASYYLLTNRISPFARG